MQDAECSSDEGNRMQRLHFAAALHFAEGDGMKGLGRLGRGIMKGRRPFMMPRHDAGGPS